MSNCVDCGATAEPDPRGGFVRCTPCRAAVLERVAGSLGSRRPTVVRTPPKAERPDRSAIEAERLRRVVEFVGESDGPVSTGAIARHLGFSLSSARRLMRAGQEQGLVRVRMGSGFEVVPADQRILARQAYAKRAA